MIKGYHIKDYREELDSYISMQYPSDLVEFYREKHHNFEDVIFGVDGKNGVRKLYLETDSFLKSVESRGEDRKYKIYMEQSVHGRVCHSWEFDAKFSKAIDTCTTSLAIFQPMHNHVNKLINICKTNAEQHLADFQEWLYSELNAQINWLGVSKNSFTVYYV